MVVVAGLLWRFGRPSFLRSSASVAAAVCCLVSGLLVDVGNAAATLLVPPVLLALAWSHRPPRSLRPLLLAAPLLALAAGGLAHSLSLSPWLEAPLASTAALVLSLGAWFLVGPAGGWAGWRWR